MSDRTYNWVLASGNINRSNVWHFQAWPRKISQVCSCMLLFPSSIQCCFQEVKIIAWDGEGQKLLDIIVGDSSMLKCTNKYLISQYLIPLVRENLHFIILMLVNWILISLIFLLREDKKKTFEKLCSKATLWNLHIENGSPSLRLGL